MESMREGLEASSPRATFEADRRDGECVSMAWDTVTCDISGSVGMEIDRTSSY